MSIRSSKYGVNHGIGLLVAFAALLFPFEAQATIPIVLYRPTVTGGTFVDPNVTNEATHVTFPMDRLSFSVGGDFRVLAGSGSSSVDVSIYTAVLTPDIRGSFNLNTSIDGVFAYSSTAAPGTAPTITRFSAASDLLTIPGSVAVTLPGSPIPLSTAPNFPTGGLELSGSANSVVTIPEGYVYQDYLEQTATITFDNVTAGETLQIQLPVSASLTPVPEPASLVLLGLGVLLTTGAAWLRKRQLDAGRIVA